MIHQQNTTYKPIIREVFAIYPGNDHVHISKRSVSYPKYVFELLQLIYYLICIFSCFHEIALYKTVKSVQFCQLSRSRFWTVSPGLQIRVWNLPNNHQSLPFNFLWTRLSDNEISNILRCLSYFINIERFLINSGMPLNYKE